MHRHRFATVHLAWAALLSLGVLALMPARSDAQAPEVIENVFEVKGVPVDVTADTAADARAQALARGQREAFRILLERLTLQKDHARLPSIGSGDLEVYVRDFEIASEKTSSVRYIAEMNVRFRADEVRGLLTEFGIAFAETPSKPVVVLPVYQASGSLLLWDDPNPWANAWDARPETYGLVPMVLPIGDLTDIGAIGAEQAVDGDQERLSAVADRYDATDTVVAHAVLGVDPATARPSLEVYVTRYGTELVEQTTVRGYAARAGEGVNAMLARAAIDITRLVEDTWKRDNLLQFGERAVLAVSAPIRGLSDWLEVRRRLSRVAVVRETEVVLLSRNEARINLHFIGDVDQLALALGQADLDLRERGAQGWFLTLAGGG